MAINFRMFANVNELFGIPIELVFNCTIQNESSSRKQPYHIFQMLSKE